MLFLINISPSNSWDRRELVIVLERRFLHWGATTLFLVGLGWGVILMVFGGIVGVMNNSFFLPSIKMGFNYILLLNYIFSYHHHHHHHHVVPPTQISLTLSRHSSLSFTASGRSSGLHPVSSQSCCMYVRAGCPAFVRPYEQVHRSTSLLQQCPKIYYSIIL